LFFENLIYSVLSTQKKESKHTANSYLSKSTHAAGFVADCMVGDRWSFVVTYSSSCVCTTGKDCLTYLSKLDTIDDLYSLSDPQMITNLYFFSVNHSSNYYICSFHTKIKPIKLYVIFSLMTKSISTLKPLLLVTTISILQSNFI